MGIHRLPGGTRQSTRRAQHASPTGTIISGVLEHSRPHGPRGPIIERDGRRSAAAEFAATVRRAATGLTYHDLLPEDVVGVLAPVGIDRLTAVYAIMAAGGVALPLEVTSDLETLARLLRATDSRTIMTTAPLTGAAHELAANSRVTEVHVSHGAAPFADLAPCVPDDSGYDPARFLFSSGVLTYPPTAGDATPTRHTNPDLLARFARLDHELRLDAADTVLVDATLAEPDTTVLPALALWRGATVVTTTAVSTPPLLRAIDEFGVTVADVPPSGSGAPPRSPA